MLESFKSVMDSVRDNSPDALIGDEACDQTQLVWYPCVMRVEFASWLKFPPDHPAHGVTTEQFNGIMAEIMAAQPKKFCKMANDAMESPDRVVTINVERVDQDTQQHLVKAGMLSEEPDREKMLQW